MRVSEIRVKQTRVNQGLGVIFFLEHKMRPLTRTLKQKLLH